MGHVNAFNHLLKLTELEKELDLAHEEEDRRADRSEHTAEHRDTHLLERFADPLVDVRVLLYHRVREMDHIVDTATEEERGGEGGGQ